MRGRIKIWKTIIWSRVQTNKREGKSHEDISIYRWGANKQKRCDNLQSDKRVVYWPELSNASQGPSISLSILPVSSSPHSVECNGGEDEEWFDCKQLIVSIPRISSVPRNRIFGMQQRTCVCLGNLKEEETFCNSLHLDKWNITFDVLCKRCSFMALLNRTNNAENFNSSTRLEFLPFL